MDTADGVGLGLFTLAILIVLPVLIYPSAKAYLEHRDHKRRMSRAWRESPPSGRPKKRHRHSSSRS